MQNSWMASTLAVVALVSVALGGCSAANQTSNQTSEPKTVNLNLPKDPAYTGPLAAVYQGGSITKQELDAEYNLQVVLPGLSSRETKEDFLKYYVVWYKCFYAKAPTVIMTPVNVQSAEQMADQYISGLAGTEYKSKQDVLNKMKALNLTMADLVLLAEKGQVLQQYLQTQLKHATVSDKDAENYYSDHKSDFIEVTVDQVLLSSEEKAKQIQSELENGANFAQLADQNSMDPSVKQNHGHFANTLSSQFVSQFAQACDTLPIGVVSSPVQTQFGYHVLRVDSRRQLPYGEVENQIKIQLLPKTQQQKEQALYNEAALSAKIQIKMSPSDL